MAPRRSLSYDDQVKIVVQKIVVLRDEGYSLATIASKVRCVGFQEEGSSTWKTHEHTR